MGERAVFFRKKSGGDHFDIWFDSWISCDIAVVRNNDSDIRRGMLIGMALCKRCKQLVVENASLPPRC